MKKPKHNTRTIKRNKRNQGFGPLQMLTCYDFQTAQMLNETELDLILVGDSLGNVVLGHETTVSVTLEEMKIFCKAVKRGATQKFVVGDLPFGSYPTLEKGLESGIELFQSTGVEAIKLEGGFDYQLELIERLTQVGIPVMGHIGLTPQSVHQQGGYYVHGKDEKGAQFLKEKAVLLEKAGAFAVVLECVEEKLSKQITDLLSIPTIGIGSGEGTDGQVLVINDLLQMGSETPPKFVDPVANFYQVKLKMINSYLEGNEHSQGIEDSPIHTH